MILLISVAALLFAIFPLTDTDIWWHLACAREWVTTWTPVREPIVNVHEYFQLVMRLVFECGGAFGNAGDGSLSRDALNCGAGALVAFKAVLWGSVFALFLWPAHRELRTFSMRSPSRLRSMWLLRLWFLFCAVLLLFIFRFQLEMRPVVFSLLFLGVFWNVLPPLFARRWSGRKSLAIAVATLMVQWIWCKCQGLYILGPLFALLACAMARVNASRVANARCRAAVVDAGCRVVAAVECDCADAAADCRSVTDAKSRIADARCDVAGADARCRVVAAVECDCADAAADCGLFVEGVAQKNAAANCGLFVEGVAQKNAAADCRSVTDAKSRIADARCDVAGVDAGCRVVAAVECDCADARCRAAVVDAGCRVVAAVECDCADAAADCRSVTDAKSRIADARCDVAGADARCRVVAAVECDCADAAANCGLFVEGVAQKNAAADCRSVTDAKSRIANAKCDVAGVDARCRAAVVDAGCCHANAPQSLSRRTIAEIAFVVLLFLMPLLHREGVNLLLYPFGLLNRLLGMSPSAAVFATEIAENRSPISLALLGENLLSSVTAACLCIAFLATFAVAAVKFRDHLKSSCLMNVRVVWLLLMCVLALVAERNWVLFMPPALYVTLCALLKSRTHLCTLLRTHLLAHSNIETEHPHRMLILAPIFGLSLMLGFWCKSLLAYDSAVAYQRVPVNAAEWMLEHPHGGRLFNDDRAGGYLALVNPSDSIYIDGRFILKTADFFERYLRYAQEPELFLHDADSLNMDRAIFPLRYYARWNEVLDSLAHAENWHLVYRDDFFAVMDRTLNVKNFAK